MATFGPQTIDKDNGTLPTYTAVSASDVVNNDGISLFHVKNAGGSSDTMSFIGANMCNHGQLHNLSQSVAPGTEIIVGPFPIKRFGLTMTVTHSFVTSVT